jgi:hypothetical protein
MGGIGGAALTSGVCDKCWGTGRTDQKGADLMAIRNAGFSEAKTASSEWFSRRIGIGINSQKEHFRAIAKKLRAVRDNFWTHRAADTLADALEEMAVPKED